MKQTCGRSRMVPRGVALAAAVLIGLAASAATRAQSGRFYTKQDIGIDQKLGNQVPMDATFTDAHGTSVRLGDLFEGKPAIISLVFYRCTGACTLEENGLARAFKTMRYSVGDQFNVITVSIDPRETPDLALGKKTTYVKMAGRPHAAEGWHFLVGPQQSITALAKAVGFRYVYNADTNTYAHAAGIMVATAQGKLSRYFYGINYNPRDLALALDEASSGKIGSLTDQVVLFLCHFDPTTGRYTLSIFRALQIGGFLTLACVGGLIGMLTVGSRRSKKDAVQSETPELTHP